ncbi:MAG: hypothetical protein U1E65_22945 [Myxococcota bacterium]
MSAIGLLLLPALFAQPAGQTTTATAAGPSAEDPVAPQGAATSTTTLFVKGDLIYPGMRELLSRYDHGGLRLGPHILGRDVYLGVDPGFAIYPGEWGIALHVPLNLLMLQAGTNAFGGLKVRRQDWDEAPDFARVVRFISYGRREAPLYFAINSLRPRTIGHGELMLNYQPNIDIDRSMTGFIFEANAKVVGVQVQLNDVTFQNRVMGALAYLKPFGLVEGDYLSSFSLGVEYAGDWLAPKCVLPYAGAPACVPGSGNAAGPDPLTGANRDRTFVRTDADLGRPIVQTTGVHALGASAEMRFWRSLRSDLKLYGTFHQFFDHGNGIAAGVSGRFTTGEEEIQAFRLRAEYRNYASDYSPSYFDTLYEVSKYQYVGSRPGYQVSPTKYQAVFGDPGNGFALSDTDRRHGFRVEASWAWFSGDRNNKRLGLGIGLADSTGRNDTEFYAHLELPLFKYLQLFGTFIRVNGDGLGDIFSSSSDNMVILSGLRLQVLPFLFVNAHYSRSFQIIRSPGQEFHLGNSLVVDDSGRPSPFFTSDRIFENVQTLFIEVEIGLEFKGRD